VIKKKYRGLITVILLTAVMALFLFVFNDASFYINFSYLVTFYLGGLLILDLGKKIPLRSLVLFISSFQYLMAPSLDYEFLGTYNPYFKMRIPQDDYFSFVLYAFLALWLGLSFPLRKVRNEKEILNTLKKSPRVNFKIGVTLVCIGFVTNYLSVIFTIPSGFNFIVTLLTLMRFVGILFIWLSDGKHKKLIIGVVIFEYSLFALTSGIFIQVIILSIFLYAYYTMLNQPNKVRIIAIVAVAAAGLFLLQSVKKDYRQQIWVLQDQNNKIGILSGLLSDRVSKLDGTTFLYTASNVNMRLNQGWVMQLIMTNIPVKKPFLNGEVFWDEFSGLFLPRFILNDKATVQSSAKFEKFAGYKLLGYTIAVGILGDGYGNFGVEGGIIFCFCIGMFFNLCIYAFYRISELYPSVFLWCIFIFFYLIRAGDDTYIICNWLIKSSMMLWAVYFLFKKSFIASYQPLILKRRRMLTQSQSELRPS
jgi:hypothetical protein